MALACPFKEGRFFYIRQATGEDIPVVYLEKDKLGLASEATTCLASAKQHAFNQSCENVIWPQENEEGHAPAQREIEIKGTVLDVPLKDLFITEMVCQDRIGLGLGIKKPVRERAAKLALALALVPEENYDGYYCDSFKKLLDERKITLRMAMNYKRFNAFKVGLQPKSPETTEDTASHQQICRNNPIAFPVSAQRTATPCVTDLPCEPDMERPVPLTWAEAHRIQTVHRDNLVGNHEAYFELYEDIWPLLKKQLDESPAEDEITSDLTSGKWPWQKWVSFLPEEIKKSVIGEGIYDFRAVLSQTHKDRDASAQQPYFRAEQKNGVRHRLWVVLAKSGPTAMFEQEEARDDKKRRQSSMDVFTPFKIFADDDDLLKTLQSKYRKMRGDSSNVHLPTDPKDIIYTFIEHCRGTAPIKLDLLDGSDGEEFKLDRKWTREFEECVKRRTKGNNGR